MESLEAIITPHRLKHGLDILPECQTHAFSNKSSSQLASGKRPRGAPKGHHKDQLKATLKTTDTDSSEMEDGDNLHHYLLLSRWPASGDF